MIRIMASCHSFSASVPFSKDRERADDRRALDPLQGEVPVEGVCPIGDYQVITTGRQKPA